MTKTEFGRRPCAFGGGVLDGDRLVRIAYLDEAGIGDPAQEPFVVVAGIVLHGDKQWRLLEERLADMIERHIKPDRREGAYFHAKDIYHGTKAFHRDVYTKDERFAMLDELVSLPRELGFPIVHAAVPRAEVHRDHPTFSKQQVVEHAHTMAFTVCLMQVEKFMREWPSVEGGEVCSIVVEDHKDMRKALKQVSRDFRKPEAARHSEEYFSLH